MAYPVLDFDSILAGQHDYPVLRVPASVQPDLLQGKIHKRYGLSRVLVTVTVLIDLNATLDGR
jgi:hypothetical protein